METFWFFRLRFRRAYDSAYDSDFCFSLGHKRSYDSAYDSDSVASESSAFRLLCSNYLPLKYRPLSNQYFARGIPARF